MLITRSTLQPTVAALVALALADGDFVGDLVPQATHTDLVRLAADYTERAADTWEDAEDALPGTVAPALLDAVRIVLVGLANNVLNAAECDALDAAADALQAGDADRAGKAIPYDTYRSA